jgi:DNA-binding SARP family transcriptional activator
LGERCALGQGVMRVYAKQLQRNGKRVGAASGDGELHRRWGRFTVEFRLLGPVQIGTGSDWVDAGEPRKRVVLAALLVDVGEVVTDATMIDRVWGEKPPAQASRTLGTYVARIRGLVRQLGDVSVARRHGGFQLVAHRDHVDLHRFRRLVQVARAPHLPDRERSRLLSESLELWSGEALTGIAGDWAARIRARLGQERLDAVAEWAGAELRAGDPAAITGVLTETAEANPLMEPLTVLLVRALVAAGRPTEALERCRAHRELLASAYGTDQCLELRTLYEAVLRDDVTRAVAPPAAPPILTQLPPDVRGFVGRAREIAHLDKLVAMQACAVAVSGTAGVGKTSLAVHWAYTMTDRFPDGQLYLNLRGYGPEVTAMDPACALHRCLAAFGVPDADVPAELDVRAALYRKLLAERRALVILDNARDSAQVRPLLSGGGPSLVLVTSRAQLTGLVAIDNVEPVAVDQLSLAEAYDLLSARIGADRVGEQPDAAAEIVNICARLPLALSLVGARAAVRSHISMRTLADTLRATPWEVLSGDGPESDMRTVLSWSYRTLGPSAARLFRLLGLHPLADVTVAAAANLAGTPVAEVRMALEELVAANLIAERRLGWYGLHSLQHAFAQGLTDVAESDDELQAAMLRVTGPLAPHRVSLRPGLEPCAI